MSSRWPVIALGNTIPSQRGYYLIYPTRNETLPSLAAFREWLLEASPLSQRFANKIV
ncbi:hypothetical protein [Castellaniella hirudinis]|uniref:hypothetical protein n=1 Tax=Castellaniella hirudinis TaxID=1144617 RepID=UPI0039C1D799